MNYAAIIDGLRLLRQSAGPIKVLGSETHGFRTHAPLPEAVVREFEKKHRIELPSDYRGFLMEVGNGGAGPAYGLFQLGEMDDAFEDQRWKEGNGFIGILSKPFPHVAAWNDRGEEPEYDASCETDPRLEVAYERRLDAWERLYWSPDNVNGAIPICHLGCAHRQWLVVSGSEAGHVWDDDRADRGGLKPVQQAGQDRVTFRQWYDAWLNDALEHLGAGA